MNFDPITSRRNFEEVADKIRQIILNGSSEPGQRLPSEKELASQFQVGRQAVREGLRILEVSGLVTVRKGSNGGIFVADLSTENITTSISNIIKLGNVSLKDITEVRIELEKIILNYAIERMTKVDLDKLKDSVYLARKKLSNGESPAKENLEFHLILSRATKNEMFHILMESVIKIVSQFLLKLTPTLTQSKRVLEDHGTLVELIEKRNLRLSVIKMENHLSDIEKRLSKTSSAATGKPDETENFLKNLKKR